MFQVTYHFKMGTKGTNMIISMALIIWVSSVLSSCITCVHVYMPMPSSILFSVALVLTWI